MRLCNRAWHSVLLLLDDIKYYYCIIINIRRDEIYQQEHLIKTEIYVAVIALIITKSKT